MMTRPTSKPGGRQRLPHRFVPLAYFAVAHVSLALALSSVAWEPELLAASFYHPRLLAAVHLVTLGWITGSILGALYLVPPMAMRSRLAPSAGDGWALALFTAGTSGVVAHFWIGELSGVGWSGLVILLAAAWVGWRVLPPISRAPVPSEIKAHFVLAFLNLLLGSILGIAIAVDRLVPVLPSPFFGEIFAHAHLLVLGWATMMVMAAGYRLLPMVLPAAMPEGWRVAATAWLLEAGVLALTIALLGTFRGLAWLGLALSGAAVTLFLANAVWMLRHPKPRPKALPRPDLPALHALGALVSLGIAAILGGVLMVLGPDSPPGLRAAYGVLALIGFLSQMIVGMAQRLVPWLAWMWAWARSGYTEVPPVPYAIPARWVQALTLVTWWSGIPLLALGSGLGHAGAVRVGALLLLLGTLGSTWQLAAGARIAYRDRPS